MRKFLLFILVFYSGYAFSLGGFGTYSEATQNVLKTVVTELDIVDRDNSIKEEIYNSIDYVFSDDYYSYWLGYNDLSASRYDGKKGFVQFMVPTNNNGIYLVTFAKRSDVDQIIITTSQIRHGSKEGALQVYEDNKADSEGYKLLVENDSFAMFQESGKVSFDIIDVDGRTGSAVYTQQTYVDL